LQTKSPNPRDDSISSECASSWVNLCVLCGCSWCVSKVTTNNSIKQLLTSFSANPQAIAHAQSLSSPRTRESVDRIAPCEWARRQTKLPPTRPSPSLSDGRSPTLHSYGDARLATLTPPTPRATPEMRYIIGSISKQLLSRATVNFSCLPSTAFPRCRRPRFEICSQFTRSPLRARSCSCFHIHPITHHNAAGFND